VIRAIIVVTCLTGFFADAICGAIAIIKGHKESGKLKNILPGSGFVMLWEITRK
jgi:hypothetical protein